MTQPLGRALVLLQRTRRSAQRRDAWTNTARPLLCPPGLGGPCLPPSRFCPGLACSAGRGQQVPCRTGLGRVQRRQPWCRPGHSVPCLAQLLDAFSAQASLSSGLCSRAATGPGNFGSNHALASPSSQRGRSRTAPDTDWPGQSARSASHPADCPPRRLLNPADHLTCPSEGGALWGTVLCVTWRAVLRSTHRAQGAPPPQRRGRPHRAREGSRTLCKPEEPPRSHGSRGLRVP